MAISRDFKGVWIPREIWLSDELTLQEKVFIVEVDSLTQNDKGYCYASNAHFSQFFNVAKNRISKIVSNLHKKGILDVWDIREGAQIIERRMKINSGCTLFTKSDEGGSQKDTGVLTKSDEGCSQKGEGSNTLLTIHKRDTKSTNVDLASRPKEQDNSSVSEEDILDQKIQTILDYWEFNGGKVHKDINAIGAIKIRNMVYELLIEGRNPYISVCDDPDLKFKQWTTEEIIQCIDYHVDELNKQISKSYFDIFIVYRNYRKRTRNVDYSPLLDSFVKIKENVLDESSEKLKKKLSSQINGTPVSPKVFSKASKYLTHIAKTYKVSDGACVTLRKSMLNVFARYVEEKSNNVEWKLSYIAGDTFREEFLAVMLKRNVIMKKKAKRVDGKVVYY